VKYLVDANILSEATKPRPAEKVLDWLRRNEHEMALDPVIVGEIRFGILLLPKGKRRRRLETWFDDGIANLLCLPWHAATGLRWAKLLADLRSRGLSMPVKDSMIASTALLHGLTMATRNQIDFTKAGVAVVNPFVDE
jgi:predicted nucleic acid-binding protein